MIFFHILISEMKGLIPLLLSAVIPIYTLKHFKRLRMVEKWNAIKMKLVHEMSLRAKRKPPQALHYRVPYIVFESVWQSFLKNFCPALRCLEIFLMRNFVFSVKGCMLNSNFCGNCWEFHSLPLWTRFTKQRVDLNKLLRQRKIKAPKDGN